MDDDIDNLPDGQKIVAKITEEFDKIYKML